MTKSHSHSGSKKTPARAHPRRQSPPDGAVYIGLVMIGVFAMVLWYLVFEETWTHGLIGYVIAVAVLVNLYTWRVTQGRRLANWQQSLARLPLRWVGYGTGRQLEGPIEASDHVVIVEDVATSGGQAIEAAKVVIATGAAVERIIATIDRQEGDREKIEAAGYQFESLFTVDDLGIKK